MDIQKNCQDKEFPAGGSHFYSRATPRIISVDPPFVDDLSVRFYLLYETKSLIDTFNATDTGDIRMATYLYLATAIGLFVVTQTDGNLTVVGHTLKEQPLTSVAVSRGVILAGTTSWPALNRPVSLYHGMVPTRGAAHPRSVNCVIRRAGFCRTLQKQAACAGLPSPAPLRIRSLGCMRPSKWAGF
jgi:hypothetical protein